MITKEQLQIIVDEYNNSYEYKFFAIIEDRLKKYAGFGGKTVSFYSDTFNSIGNAHNYVKVNEEVIIEKLKQFKVIFADPNALSLFTVSWEE